MTLGTYIIHIWDTMAYWRLSWGRCARIMHDGGKAMTDGESLFHWPILKFCQRWKGLQTTPHFGKTMTVFYSVKFTDHFLNFVRDGKVKKQYITLERQWRVSIFHLPFPPKLYFRGCKKNAFVDYIWNRFCFYPLSCECITCLAQDLILLTFIRIWCG